MFVGRYVSEHEIVVTVIVKHLKHIGTIRAFCLSWGDLLSFLVSGGYK